MNYTTNSGHWKSAKTWPSALWKNCEETLGNTDSFLCSHMFWYEKHWRKKKTLMRAVKLFEKLLMFFLALFSSCVLFIICMLDLVKSGHSHWDQVPSFLQIFWACHTVFCLKSRPSNQIWQHEDEHSIYVFSNSLPF